MKRNLRDTIVELDDIELPSPYPINRRKPGVTLPVPGGIKPFNIMLRKDCPDMQKEEIKSLKEIAPVRSESPKRKKGKKK